MNKDNTVSSDIATNGMKIEAVVTQVRPDNTKNCWRAEARVDGVGMAFSHHDARHYAEAWAKNMQLTYMQVHSCKR